MPQAAELTGYCRMQYFCARKQYVISCVTSSVIGNAFVAGYQAAAATAGTTAVDSHQTPAAAAAAEPPSCGICPEPGGFSTTTTVRAMSAATCGVAG